MKPISWTFPLDRDLRGQPIGLAPRAIIQSLARAEAQVQLLLNARFPEGQLDAEARARSSGRLQAQLRDELAKCPELKAVKLARDRLLAAEADHEAARVAHEELEQQHEALLQIGLDGEKPRGGGPGYDDDAELHRVMLLETRTLPASAFKVQFTQKRLTMFQEQLARAEQAVRVQARETYERLYHEARRQAEAAAEKSRAGLETAISAALTEVVLAKEAGQLVLGLSPMSPGGKAAVDMAADTTLAA
jgi:hypothetical protein